jgi:hypothetical protein
MGISVSQAYRHAGKLSDYAASLQWHVMCTIRMTAELYLVTDLDTQHERGPCYVTSNCVDNGCEIVSTNDDS